MRRVLVLFALAAIVGLAVPGAATAGPSEDYLDVYKGYQRTGSVDGCGVSAAKLASAQEGVPPDIETYAPDFPDALDAALRRRASGSCDRRTAGDASGVGIAAAGGGSSGSGAIPGAAGDAGPGGAGTPGAPGAPAPGDPGAPGVTPAPAPEAVAAPALADGAVAAASSRRSETTDTGGAPLPLLLLAAVAVLAALIALAWAVVRFLGLDPPWLVSGRHAASEAGWRASASWAEFGDWLRVGR